MESFARHERKIWKSRLFPQLKRRVFVASVESFLLYGCEAWSLTVQMERNIDGIYTRMLRAVLNASWEDHTENVDLYGTLPRVTDKIRARRMGFAGPCVRHPELVASNLILWETKHGTRSRGRPATTYIDTLRRDTGLGNREFKKLRRLLQRKRHMKMGLCVRLSVLRLFQVGHVIQNRRSALSLSRHEWFFMQKQRVKDLLLVVHVVVRTPKMKISRRYFADYVRQQIAPKSVPHVQHDYFTSFNQSNSWLWRCLCRCRRHFLNFLILTCTRSR